jgi:PAS domain S-box-containing protein
MLKKCSAVWLLFAGFAVSTIFIVSGIGYYVISRDYQRFNAEALHLRAEYIASQQQQIKQEVEQVVAYIQYNWAKAAEDLREDLKDRTNEAFDIATNLYRVNHGRVKEQETRNIILEALRPIRFNHGLGYYFATGLDGVQILDADRPELEGQSMLDTQDTQSAYVIRHMIELIRREGEGYYQYSWTKPNVAGKDFPKIAYARYFAPFDGFIGTSEYLDDMEQVIQREVLERIGKIRFGKEGYVFVVSYDGVTLMNDMQPELIGKNIWDMTDPNGVKVIQELRRGAEKTEGDFVHYHWEKPSTKKISPKVSFVQGFPQWGWMVGAGVYLDDIEPVITAMETTAKRQMQKDIYRLGFALTAILAAALLIGYSLSHYLKRQLDLFFRFFKEAETGCKPIATEGIFFSEFQLLGQSANRMLVERKKAEDSLRESEELYRTLVSLSPDAISVADMNVLLIFSSPKSKQMFGRPSDEQVLGRSILSSVVPEEQEKAYANIRRLLTQERLTPTEFTLRKDDGARFIGEVNASVIYSPDGSPMRMIVITRDITDRKRAEEDLKQTNSYLENIFDNSPDAIAIVDNHGKFIRWNKMAEVLYGYTFEEMKGKPCFDLYADKDELDKMLISLRGEGSVKKWEIRMERKDGSIVPFEVSIGLLKDSQNKNLGSIGVARDLSGIKETLSALKVSNERLYQEIAERKHTEEALRESELRLRTILQTVNEGFWLIDNDTSTMDLNRRMCAILGRNREEVFGRKIFDFVDSENKAVFERQMRLRAQGEVGTYEIALLRPDGSNVCCLFNATPLLDESGNKVGSFAMVTDITERKLAEDALRESEERFSRFFRVSPVGTSISCLSDGELVDANDAFLGLSGYTRVEVIGRRSLELGIWANPEDRSKMLKTLEEQGRLQDFETKFRRKSGQIIDVLISAAVIEMAGQQYMLGLTHDITERKRGEEERKKLEEQLFQAQKMESVGRLAGGVAHDFNNMLGVIIGRAEMALGQDVPPDKLHHHLEEILKAGLRSADLTRQLLAFARQQTAIPKILQLNDTISGMLKMLRRLIGEDIDLLWAPGPDLWKVKIDPSQVDQIMANLVVNARDAISGVGAVTMRTENVVIDDSKRAETPELIAGQYVLLTVSDTGTGMSQEVREKIFEPFFTTKELGKGTGLGLSTVYGVVKQNDGFIYVGSEPGKGTTFKIYLLRFEGETAQVPSEEITGKSPTGTETVLLVEDDEAILNLGRMILENLGYTVLAAQSPVHSIRLVEEHPGDIHLLITDVVMPQMHGRDLAEQLRVIRPKLKCLFMSGYTADVIAHRGILDEGLNFLQKPFGSDELAARVRQVLDHLE